MRTSLICMLLLGLLSPTEGRGESLVAAIQRQESGGNPLALNIAGQSVIPKTREEAEALIERAWAAGVSFDVGLMQINCQWMRRFGVDPKSMLDPDRNLAWGKWILDGVVKLFLPTMRYT